MRWSKESLRLMINLTERNNLYFLVFSALGVLISLLIQVNLIIPLLLVGLCGYLKASRSSRKNLNFLNIALLYLLNFAIGYLTIQKAPSLFYIPFAVIPMLSILLFNDLEISFIISLASSVSIAYFSPSPFLLLLLSLNSSLSAILLVRGSRKRITIIQSGIIVGLIQAASLLFIENFQIINLDRHLLLFINGLASSIIVLGILPVFEYLFRTVTNISLLELGDFNHPLLQRLMLEAQGTYLHSLVVGNLSESACRAVGANSLLARIGAYYHDIGKIEKAEYFSENQEALLSKHDDLSPSMSKLIIMNHVKEGVDLAKKYKLSPVLIDFITQHHGNSLVYYFYRKALEGLEENQEVEEEPFRYPGPKPTTKETAIVLLADSAEAATRALKEPSQSKIEEVVHKIINNKFIDGQLDECDLTLKDLEIIAAVFIRILGGIYHARVSYPEETRSDNYKESPKEDSHLSEEDKKDNS